ncbi:FkbM family methyltransferase [Candidatus Pacearchaeota archaeon]|nr:FkbM family methyltransferase [Candidatus Pacearchaeota archaeon]
MKIRTLFRIIKTVKNWPLYLLDYARMIKGKYIVYKLRNGIKYKVRAGTTDRTTLNEIWVHHAYGGPGQIREIKTVIDIGAHIGFFSLFASYYSPHAKILAFEPAPSNFKLLQENIALNNLKNITAYNEAVSSKKGVLTMFFSDNPLCHSIYESPSARNKQHVNATSLADIMKRNAWASLDFLKMDCEGAEYDILFSCSPAILKKIRMIGLEYHNLDSRKNIRTLKGFLEKRGFSVTLKPDSPQQGMLYAKRNNNLYK